MNVIGSSSGSVQTVVRSRLVATLRATLRGTLGDEKQLGARLKFWSIVIVTLTGALLPAAFAARRVKVSVPLGPAAAV